MEHLERCLIPSESDNFKEWNSLEISQVPHLDEVEAEVPVPENPTPKQLAKSRLVVSQMKISQKIGFLLLLNSLGILNRYGVRRLIRLQDSQSLEALESGYEFFQRLLSDEKLQKDFWIARFQLQSVYRLKKQPPLPEVRRIGVGYRDKGTLPSDSQRERQLANQESFLYLRDFDKEVRDTLKAHCDYLIVEGEWLDLTGLSELDPRFLEEIRASLSPSIR